MDRRERFDDPEETQRIAMEAHQAKLWTALPGIVQSFDPDKQTCVVQPSIKGRVRSPDGSVRSINMPLLLDCPVQWQGGGGVTLTFPIKPNDECLVVFASRCIDAWWQSGGVQEQAEFRMHDLSDGFVLVGVRSNPRAFAVSTEAAQLRTDDGLAYVEINPDTHNIKAETTTDIEAIAGGSIEMTAAVSITMNAPLITLNGKLVQGKGSLGGICEMEGPLRVINDVVAGERGADVSLLNHVHSGVQSGGSNTGAPVPT